MIAPPGRTAACRGSRTTVTNVVAVADLPARPPLPTRWEMRRQPRECRALPRPTPSVVRRSRWSRTPEERPGCAGHCNVDWPAGRDSRRSVIGSGGAARAAAWRTADFRCCPDPLLIDEIRGVIGAVPGAASETGSVFAVAEQPQTRRLDAELAVRVLLTDSPTHPGHRSGVSALH